MTSNTNDHSNDHGRNVDEERELTSVASRLLGAVPLRTPETFPATERCGWCSNSADSHDATEHDARGGRGSRADSGGRPSGVGASRAA